MRAKVQITIEWELASPDDYPDGRLENPDNCPVEAVNSWLEAAAYDIENCISIVSDFDLSIVYGTPELEGDPETEPFRLED